jgi:hypothetical protein
VNTVVLQPIAFGSDGDGGRLPLPAGPPSAPIRCRAHPASARDVPVHLREEGVEYLTFHLFGPTPPAVRIRDRVLWLDFTPAKVCTVLGPPRTATGEFSTWLVDCEYRVPPGPGQV